MADDGQSCLWICLTEAGREFMDAALKGGQYTDHDILSALLDGFLHSLTMQRRYGWIDASEKPYGMTRCPLIIEEHDGDNVVNIWIYQNWQNVSPINQLIDHEYIKLDNTTRETLLGTRGNK